MDNLLSIVSKYSTHEQEQTAQTALFTIKLLAKRLAEKHPTEFSSVSLFYLHKTKQKEVIRLILILDFVLNFHFDW